MRRGLGLILMALVATPAFAVWVKLVAIGPNYAQLEIEQGAQRNVRTLRPGDDAPEGVRLLGPGEPGGRYSRPVDSGAQAAPGLVIYRFTHSLYYANCKQFANEIALISSSAEPPLRWLCLDASAIDDVDFSAAETLRSVHARLKESGIRLVVAEEMEDVKAEAHYRLNELIGADAFYDHPEDVMRAYRQQFDLPAPGNE